MDRVYTPGQTLRGIATINTRGAGSLQHEGITLVAEGAASLQLSAKSVGLFEAFYSSIKPVQLLLYQQDLQPSGRLPDGRHEFEFELPLQPLPGEKLHESYHGVFVNLQYVITVEVRRGMLNKNIKRSIEFIVEAPEPKAHKLSPAKFNIVPESLENVRKSALHHVPSFAISGHLDSVTCNIAQPLTGEVTIEECSATIRSIELQLVRVETCGYQDGTAREATEIQNIQIADGPVCHGWPIPVHMVFPRLFTCPTISTRTFKVDFEVNLVILFSDGHLLTENFPLKLVRGAPAPVGAASSEATGSSDEPPPLPPKPKAAAADPLAAAAGPPSWPAPLPVARAEPAPPAAPPPPPKPPKPKPAANEDPLSSLLASEPEPVAAPPPAPPPTVDPLSALSSDPLGDQDVSDDPLR